MQLRAQVLALLVTGSASAQVADLDLRTQVFHEVSSESPTTVINPVAALSVKPAEWLRLEGGYEADIVSGASEPLKAGPLVDVVTAATKYEDVRHVGHGGFELSREHTKLGASFSHGQEHDYRSNAVAATAATDFFQRNTELEIGYAHGFDEVCTSAYAESLSPTLRQPLDSSKGCFSDAAAERSARDVRIDDFRAAWTQSWTRLFETQLVLSGALQAGFLGNPYRAVVIGPSGQSALENHPDHRARSAASLGALHYVPGLKSAAGIEVRGYWDTWNLWSQTYEISFERYFAEWLRLRLHGRWYTQTGALFWSNDYTGGEPATGQRGQFWSGDRELSPLRSLSGGARLLGSWRRAGGERIIGVFSRLSANASFDLMKVYLKDFTLGTRAPDDTLSLFGGGGVEAEF